jgi:hypothetical protein
MIDIVLPLGKGSCSSDTELRIALRSIDRHAVNVRRVFVVGHRPEWFKDTDKFRSAKRPEFSLQKESRISLKVLWAFETLDTTDTVAFWNDDYVLTKNTDIASIPDLYSGCLWTKRKSPWGESRRKTSAALSEAGMPTRNYDIHMPMLFEREKFLSIRPWWGQGFTGKSVYGNHFCHEVSRRVSDCKLWTGWRRKVRRKTSNRFVISYGNAAARTGLLGWLSAQFSEPCEAEK